MSMTVTLCDSPKSDNVCRAYLAKSLSAEKSYYDGLTKASYACQTVELGQPIRIKSSIKNLLKYNYGWIDYGDGFRYYFSIRDIAMVSESMSDISYDLDCLATAYNQIGMNFPRVSLQRFNGEDPDILSGGLYDKFNFPYNPMFWDCKETYRFRADNSIASFAFLFWDSANNKFAYGFLNYPVNSINQVVNGSWIDAIKSTLKSGKTFEYVISDLVNIAYVPFALSSSMGVTAVDTNGYCYVSNSADFVVVNVPYDPKIYNKVTEKHQIYDARYNVVFEPAVGETLDLLYAQLSYCVSTISVQLTYLLDDGQYPDLAPRRIVTIPCETIDVYVDAWAEYAYRQRQYDIELRNINAKSSLANISNNAMTGAMTGAVTGSIVPGIGTAVGAVAGLAVGAIGSAIGTGITYHYGGEEQKQTDALYQKAQDTLSLVGNAGTTFIKYSRNWDFIALVIIDKQTLATYNEDIKNNGYYYTDTVIANSEYSPSATTNKKYAIKADVEIDATIPSAWRDAIADRFSKGLIIEHD